MLRVGNSIYRRALTNIPSWKEVWELFLSEPSTYETALDKAEGAADWIREHQDMTPEESAENQFEVSYEEMLDWFPSELQDKDCHRAIGVRENQCDERAVKRLDPIGIYWSEYPEFAETYWKPDHEGCVLVYRARIDVAHINVLETMVVRLHNPDEHEVRFNEGAKLYVYDCTIEREGRWSGKGESEAVKIEDYRTC